MQVTELSLKEMAEAVAQAGATLPIEQSAAWARYQETVDGRSFWGAVQISDADDKPVAYVALFDFETHGYHYLRAWHAPVYVVERTDELEREVVETLGAYVRKRDHKQVFMRIAVAADLDLCRPTLSSIPYDHTLVIDVTGGQDAILSRMKPRGRRDVRKALRESPATCADETDLAAKSFAEYYEVMVETGERDGFAPAPISDYEDMITTLGPDHCRVYASRVDGKVASWSIVTVLGTLAVRYYGASRNEFMRQHVTDKLVLFECCDLADNKGVLEYDMMGIGSDFAPSLMGLNEFKTKFAKEGVRPVAPDRDVPLRGIMYTTLTKARKVLRR